VFNLQFSSHIYLLLILAHLLGFVLCVHRCQERCEDLLFIICVSSITGIVLDWWWAGEWCTCHLRKPTIVVQPLLDHLRDKKRTFVKSLLCYQDASFSNTNIQPLPENTLFPSQLCLCKEVYRQKFAVTVHQWQECNLELIWTQIVCSSCIAPLQPTVGLHRNQGREMTSGVTQC